MEESLMWVRGTGRISLRVGKTVKGNVIWIRGTMGFFYFSNGGNVGRTWNIACRNCGTKLSCGLEELQVENVGQRNRGTKLFTWEELWEKKNLVLWSDA